MKIDTLVKKAVALANKKQASTAVHEFTLEVENVITTLYLEGDSTDMNTPGSKEEKHETKL